MASRYMELYQEYERISTELASIYKVGVSSPAIVRLTIEKAELELQLANLAETLQTVVQTPIYWDEMWEEVRV